MKKILCYQPLLAFLFALISFDAVAQNIGEQLFGCTDPAACNYEPFASIDDGSCAFGANALFSLEPYLVYEADCSTFIALDEIPEEGPYVFSEDGNVYAPEMGEDFVIAQWSACGDEATLFAPFGGDPIGFIVIINGQIIGQSEGGCFVLSSANSAGCTDESAINYNPLANEDDASCLYSNLCGNVVNVDGVNSGFYDYYWSGDWSIESQGNGMVTIEDTEMFIVGSNESEGLNVLTQATILAQFTGTYTFDYFYTTSGDAVQFDIAYYINGERVNITPSFKEMPEDLTASFLEGSVSFEASEGDLIGFGIDAIVNCCGGATLTISNFTFPAPVCNPGCSNPTADNYNPEAETFNNDVCIWTDACGNLTDSNGNGANFEGSFAPENWAFTSEGNGNYEFDAPDFFNSFGSNLVITGSDTGEGNGDAMATELSMLAPISGTYSFSWGYNAAEFFNIQDLPYYINGDAITLIDEDDIVIEENERGLFMFGGTISFYAEAGTTIGFGVDSFDDCCGAGELVIFNFAWPVDCVGGCLDDTAANYNPEVDYDNGWCLYLNACDEPQTALGNTPGFNGDYAPELWSINSMGDGSVNHDADQIVIVGSNEGEGGSEILTETTIVATLDGTYTFDWIYSTFDGAQYDIAYSINGEVVDLTQSVDEFGFSFGNSGQSGSVALEVLAGDVIGFGINAIDNCCGSATLIINHFSYPSGVCSPGCTDETACNYNADATFDDGSCDYSCYGCTDTEALNYDSEATTDDGSCIFECEAPVVTSAGLVCTEGEFEVEITVLSLGNTAPYILSNSINGDTETIDAEGVYTLGGFPEDQDVVFTVTSVEIPSCTFDLDPVGCEVNVAEFDTNELNVYPNPANNQITIVGQLAYDAQAEVRIVDLRGQLVLVSNITMSSTGQVFDLSHLAAGSYIVQVQTTEHISITKLVVRR
jgi:hypothetical protein